jgi:hypothetical protein
MAYKRRSYRSGNANGNSAVIMGTLSALTGLVLALWVFDQVLDVVIPLVNDSTYFALTISFVEDILPVVGIIAGYTMIRGAIKKMSF